MKHNSEPRDPRPGRPTAEEIKRTTKPISKSDAEKPDVRTSW